ncbi:MAG: FxsA family protein [Bacillota bacterium]|nr:FxsA family protein [Bacillota bacterium]
MRILILLIILIPAADIGILLFSGKMIGVLPTVIFIFLTGFIGAYLAKKQGLKTIQDAREKLSRGQIPGESVLDGICILIGGTLLITPGFITDLLGLLLLLPFTRKPFKWFIRGYFYKRIKNGKIKIIK